MNPVWNITFLILLDIGILDEKMANWPLWSDKVLLPNLVYKDENILNKDFRGKNMYKY